MMWHGVRFDPPVRTFGRWFVGSRHVGVPQLSTTLRGPGTP